MMLCDNAVELHFVCTIASNSKQYPLHHQKFSKLFGPVCLLWSLHFTLVLFNFTFYLFFTTTLINIGGTYVNWILFLFEVSINNSIIQDEIWHFLKWSNFKIFRYIRFKTSLLRNKIFMHSFSILDLIWQAPKTRSFLRWHVFIVFQIVYQFLKSYKTRA